MTKVVEFTLTQETKKSTRKVSSVKYSYNGNVRIKYCKLAEVIANSVWERLAKQRKTGMNLGIRLTQSFNVIVKVNGEQEVNLSQCAIEAGFKNQVKINKSRYEEDKEKEKVLFIEKILITLETSILEWNDYKNAVEFSEGEDS
jgi:hypothetical protein